MLETPSWLRLGPSWPMAAVASIALILTCLAAWRLARALRRRTWPPRSVLVAGFGAAVCTAYSADTSWDFAAHRLGMNGTAERLAMFAAAELALLSCADMARANKKATATDTAAGTPGVPGVLMWLITGVQIIPAYSESGFVGGTVRAFIGPVLAGVLWHLAMGLEIRIKRPAALSGGLLAVVTRELRERLLSRLGLTVRDRSAEQISRDRAMARAVRLAARPHLHAWGQRRLAAAVARARVGNDGAQRHRLLQELAARRSALELRTVPLPSPWASTPAPAAPYPSTPRGVTGAHLRALDRMDAVLQVHAAHPNATPAEVSALCVQHGVPVSETEVRVATRAGNPPRVPTAPHPPAGPKFVLDLQAPSTQPHPDVLNRVPVEDLANRVLLARARALDAEHRARNGRPAPIRSLKKHLGVGQDKAARIRGALRGTAA